MIPLSIVGGIRFELLWDGGGGYYFEKTTSLGEGFKLDLWSSRIYIEVFSV